ncbi:hypothetical protein AG0111_0g13161 [Alternaria gaisen]|uniref:Uncharacterized protein n=1 Tax=Alternaria gaisen TaxID=167740 RepID=A0ACB6F2I0_9PLEO|nr:hypothetical protein AG0111_0g13161 [Alternaria gaisen]
MDELRDTYEKAIRSVQPRGPYAFLGMSLGALIAFDLAKRFEQLGEEVAFVGSLDGAPRNSAMQTTTASTELLALDVLKLRGVLSWKEVEDLGEVYKKEGSGSIIARLIHSHRIALDSGGFTTDSFMAFMRTLDSGTQISSKYECIGKIGKLDVFQANPVATWNITEEQWSAGMQCWTNFVEDIKFHRVPGDHMTLISPPHIVTFQAVLAKALAYRGI